jgi:palmitoyltransferase
MFRMSPSEKAFEPANAFTHSMDPDEFYKRQQADRSRPSINASASEFRRRQPFHVRYDQENLRKNRHQDYHYGTDNESNDEDQEYQQDDEGNQHEWQPSPGEGEEGWRNSEGERLHDFGVDEDVEFYDEDDVPLGELMRRRDVANDPSFH